jgi:hypothetical protein
LYQSEAFADAMFTELDIDGSGDVNKREFLKAARSSPATAELLGVPQNIQQVGGGQDIMEAVFQVKATLYIIIQCTVERKCV